MASLQDELRKKKPFDSEEQEVVLNLQRANDQIQIHFTRLFRQYDLTPSQYNILRILRGEAKPMKSLEIADRTITVVPGITGLLDRLEEAGLVHRERSVNDRRKVLVSITPKGTELLKKLDKPLLELHRRVLGHLSADELQELNRLLNKARAGLPKATK